MVKLLPWLALLCYFLSARVTSAQLFNIVRDTTSGKVMGTSGTTIERYLGIPYAAPPVGKLRWKPPEPHPGWEDTGEIRNATVFGSSCPQRGFTEYVIGDEDCLFLNLYVPRKAIAGHFPVMVFIHGGGFDLGDGNIYDGTLLAGNNDVIVVTINYRLGVLGFLNTGDNQVTGNYGLLDQRAALQWVQDNIQNFGGDKNTVTIFGESAGAASVLFQAITPLNLGSPKLFHRVIAQSGTPLSWWAVQTEPRYYALDVFEKAGCPTFSTSHAVECLRKATPEEIISVQGWYLDAIERGVDSQWTPTIDGNFLTDIPDIMVSSEDIKTALDGRYEYLLGANDYDITGIDLEQIKTIQNEEEFKAFTSKFLRQHFMDPDKMAEVVSYNYIDATAPPSSDYDWQQLTLRVCRDVNFLAGSVNMSNIVSLDEGFNSTVFYYFFVQQPGDALIELGVAAPDDGLTNGASHAEELSYVFGIPLLLPNATDEDRELSLQIMTYWTNFAKTGNPSSPEEVSTSWPEYNWESQQYLVFGTKEEEGNLTHIEDHLESDIVVFWTEEIGFYEEGKGLDDSIALPRSNETVSTGTVKPVVNTTAGAIRGLRLETENYITDRFLRIPFAKPPLGLLRFKHPEPHPGWEGIRDGSGNISATEWVNGCPQLTDLFGTEDCLFLNIWVPGGVDVKRDQPLPVVVWFYGGAYVWGRGTGLQFYYDMQRLSNQGQVIGVSMNYRLGPLGFLSTMDEHAPGNAGFLDQVMALQWVQNNIAAFGGDRTKVTIFGESAGAGSVSFHMISPLSKDLFRRGIAESGVTPAQWTISYDPIEKAERLANLLNCTTDSSKILVRCLQNRDVGDIMRGSVFNDIGAPKDNAWTGVIDGYFIVDDPMKLLHTSADKDFLLGHNSMDGHLFASIDFLPINLESLPMSRADVEKASTFLGPDVPEYVSEAVAFKYIDWKEPETGFVWPKIAIVDMYTDVMFAMPTYWTANERAAANGTGRTFMYRFSEKTAIGFFPEWMEADHTAELKFVFGHPFGRRNFTDADRKLSLAMMTHWTNFAWSGDPNSPNQGDVYAEWPEYSLDTKYAIEFNTSAATDPSYPKILSNYRGEFVEFWTDMLKDIWTMSIDTCPVTKSEVSTKKWIGEQKVRSSRAVTCVDEPLVRATESGCIRGYEYESNGKTIERYLGIPYMKPPLESLRFKPPQPAVSWADTYLAMNYSKICPQNSVLDPDTMSEDCLYMCIYVPQVNVTADTQNGLPVMVWLHGGGYRNGNGMEKLKGDTMAALGDVIVINFNYRLGSFGFLTTDDEQSPGNYGLLDQQFALNWVKNNIANFGGNPDQMTIFGNSAGGQSVLLQTLTPTNKNLGITKAIMESAAIIPHGDLKQRDRAVSLANAASCPTNDNEAMVECLRNLDASDLLSAQATTGLSFEPTVDGEFLPTHPRELADSAEVQKWTYIIGCNNGEGSVRWGDTQTVEGEEGFHQVLNKWFEPPYGWRTNLIAQQYADYDDLDFFSDDQKMQLHLTQMFGDERYLTPGLEVAEEYTGYGSDVYFYYFTYPHDRPDFNGFPSWAGAAHSAEFSFVWGDVINDETQPEEVKDLSRKIIEYWTNFAKTGDPSTGYSSEPAPKVDWVTYKGSRPGSVAKNYLRLDLGDLTKIEQDLRPIEKSFWLDHMYAEAEFCVVEAPVTTTTISPPTVDPEIPLVITSSGAMRGKRVKNDLFDVHVFLGIPYAKPPVGNLRFAKAEKVDAWTNTFYASVPKPPCFQSFNGMKGQEDCLYLDVFLPTELLYDVSSMPVALWIHGDSIGYESKRLSGSFWSGGGSPGWDSSSTTIDPSFLANFGNMVVVRPNFRLGSFGFLTTQSEEIGGNYGLSDLKEALMWAYENAENFAGDPQKLTVIGQGSGAAAAELLAILPSTRDYVSRVISLSGSALAPWAFCINQECEKIALEDVQALGCPVFENDTATLSCLRNQPAEDILNLRTYQEVVPTPDVESNAWGTWRFNLDGDLIPKDISLEELFASSQADFMTSTMSHEFLDYLKTKYPDTFSNFLETAIEDTHTFLSHSNIELWPAKIYKALTHEYTNWEDQNDEELALESAVQYYTDLMFATRSSKSIEAKLKAGSGSLYQLVVKQALAPDGETSLPSWVGGRHGDDITYGFGMPFTQPTKYSDADREFSMAVMGYWINFAWNGNPNNAFSKQNWREFTADNKFYLQMSSAIDLPGTPTNFNIEKNDLWESVVPMFKPAYVPVVPTTPSGTTAKLSTSTKLSTTSEHCVEEYPPIGEGLGLSLTPSEADTAIYAMFSVCLILGVFLIALLGLWFLQGHMIKSKNDKILKANSFYVNGSFETEKTDNKKFSAL